MSRLTPKLCAFLTQEYIGKLKDSSVITTTDFVTINPEELVQSTGIPFKEIVAIRNVILAKSAALPVTGYDLYNSVVSSVSILSTGASGVDDVLGGGLYTGEVTEVVGDSASGKTQLCFSACVTTTVENVGHVIYIDTGAVFSARRMQHMIQHRGITETDEVLSRIQLYNAFTLFEVISVLDDILERLREGADPFYRDIKLVILDNVASVVYPVLGGESFTEYQALISQLGHKLKALAVEYPCAVLVTNNFVKGDKNSRVASLGRVWSHVPHVRLGITGFNEMASNQPRTVTVMKSCRGVWIFRHSYPQCDMTDLAILLCELAARVQNL